MRKKLKVVILLLIVFTFSSPSFSQTWEEFLISHYWQLQNPPNGFINEKLMFFANAEVSEEYWNLSTNQITNQKGSYSINGFIISLDITGEQMEFRLIYISDYKIKFRNKDMELIYAVVNSPSDIFMSNYLNSINGGYNYYTPPANNPIPTSSYKVCYTCNGIEIV